jgi:predicted DNA binding CopG/RHH family protein
MKRTIQYFTEEYLERCKELTPEQIIEFIEDYQNLIFNRPEKCQLISVKIEPSLLNAFKQKAKLEGVPYQSKMKQLMREWVTDSSKK